MVYPALVHLQPASPLADLSPHHYQVSPTRLGNEVTAAFARRPELPGVIVLEQCPLL